MKHISNIELSEYYDNFKNYCNANINERIEYKDYLKNLDEHHIISFFKYLKNLLYYKKLSQSK